MESLYILVKRGFVQRVIVSFNGKPCKAWPLASSFDDAKRLTKWFGIWKDGVRPTKIGSISGETVEGHIVLALHEGCKVMIKVVGWNQDGSPEWGHIPLHD